MSTSIQLEIPDDLAQQANEVAVASRRSLTDVVLDGIRMAVKPDLDIAALPDESILELARTVMPEAEQAELSELLAKQRESEINSWELNRLDQIMQQYRRGLLLKARAIDEAVTRRLMAPLTQRQ